MPRVGRLIILPTSVVADVGYLFLLKVENPNVKANDVMQSCVCEITKVLDICVAIAWSRPFNSY